MGDFARSLGNLLFLLILKKVVNPYGYLFYNILVLRIVDFSTLYLFNKV